jgi:5-methyltetrahydropteroyltriglutamate--homocysteine methyltransferase
MRLTSIGNYPKTPDRPEPALLRNVLAKKDRGQATDADIEGVIEQVTAEVMRAQEDAGVELLTDGQVRWQDEITYVAGGLAGVSLNGLIRFFDTNTYYRRPVAEEPIAWRAPIAVGDFRKAAKMTALPVKAVLTGPYTLARHTDGADFTQLVFDYADALNQEARALSVERPLLIQFNEPSITWHLEDIALAGEAWRRLLQDIALDTGVAFYFGCAPAALIDEATNAGFGTIGLDLTIDGSMEQLAVASPLARIAAGVVDSRNTRMEPVDVVARRLRGVLELRPSERIDVNPNMGLEFLPREKAQAKLRLLREAIDLVEGGAR